jgi:alkanesulfonate monooxygenase SsuD/methylene tetrahydromethanopterin reductase-like flavin-dependent oxidoreductase (luciferase family)
MDSVGFHFRRAQDRPQEELRDLAGVADGLGYQTIWVSEGWGRDAFVLLSRLVDVVKRAELATGIVNVWSRTPGTLAQAATTLDEATEGRVILGLGVSGPRVVQGWHEIAWSKPLQRLERVTEMLRSIFAGERRNGFRLQFKPPRANIPIYWGVFGSTSVRTAGAIADGWLANETPLELLPSAIDPFRQGAQNANRALPPIAYMLQLTACDTEEQLEAARTRLRWDIAFRVGGLGPYHRAALATGGFGLECEDIARYWLAGEHDQAAARVTESLMNAMGCIGTAVDCATYVEAARSAGTSCPTITVPRGTPLDRIVATLGACAPRKDGPVGGSKSV